MHWRAFAINSSALFHVTKSYQQRKFMPAHMAFDFDTDSDSDSDPVAIVWVDQLKCKNC